MNYNYNIKGALTHINDPGNLGDDLFGMTLYYDSVFTVENIINTPCKDGKISAMQWNSKNLDQVQTYMFTYDDLNRLTSAKFAPDHRYDVDLTYDKNGNIKNLRRYGQKITMTSGGFLNRPEKLSPLNSLTIWIIFTPEINYPMWMMI